MQEGGVGQVRSGYGKVYPNYALCILQMYVAFFFQALYNFKKLTTVGIQTCDSALKLRRVCVVQCKWCSDYMYVALLLYTAEQLPLYLSLLYRLS